MSYWQHSISEGKEAFVITIHVDEFVFTLDYYSYSYHVIDEDDLL